MEIKISETNKENLINVEIEKNVYQGYGLAHFNDKTIFVSKAIEGDFCSIQIKYKKSDVYFADVIKIIRPSKYRSSKIHCDVFYECGGCDWLYADYNFQVKTKLNILKELYKTEVEIEKSDKIYHYRNKNFMPVSISNGKPLIGIYKRKSHEIIEHKNCYLTPLIFDKIALFLKEYLNKVKVYDERTHTGNLRHIGFRINSQNEIILVLVTKNSRLPFTKLLVKKVKRKFKEVVGIVQNINRKKGNKILGDEEKILYGKNYFYEKIGNILYKVNYASFFQVNIEVTKKMYDYIKSLLECSDVIIDAFSGIGTIGIYVSEIVKKVYLIENNKKSFEDLKENIKINKKRNCIPIFGDANSLISKIEDNSLNTIILDPPRKGITKDIKIPTGVEKIIYVSCNPFTQKRDVEFFKNIGFKIFEIKAFDMFPHTYHIETVISLKKNEMED